MSTDENNFRRVDWSGDPWNPSDDDDDADGLPLQPPRGPGLSAEDLELLTLAARALGAVRVDEVEGEDWVNLHFADGSTIWNWNPLVYKDNAFDLIVRLRLDVLHGLDEVAINDQNVVLVDYTEYGSDPAADACRVVTSAAAVIGKSLE
jgi:hypothetical protein